MIVLSRFRYSLTVVDALDTMAVMGNYTEFRRVAELLTRSLDFDKDINVSVSIMKFQDKDLFSCMTEVEMSQIESALSTEEGQKLLEEIPLVEQSAPETS